MKKMAVFGCNRISFEAISRLDTSLYQILLIETDAQRTALAIQHGFQPVSIDFCSDEALKGIGIGKDIEIIFCCLPQDADNVFLTLSARSIDRKLIIISVVENPESAQKLLAAGANKIVNPYEICGRKIYNLLKNPQMNSILDHTVFGRQDLKMAEVKICQGSCLENQYTSTLHLNDKYNLILIGIVDPILGNDLQFFAGESTHQLKVGQILVVMGSSREIKLFKKEVNSV